MRLKLVVLPAPFGPISAKVSRSLTAKLRSCTARSPPNRRLRLRMTSASAIERHFLGARRAGASNAVIDIGQDADQSGWPVQDHRDQDQAVDRQLNPAMAAAEPALQQCGGR